MYTISNESVLCGHCARVSVRLTEAACAAALAVLGGGFEWIIADVLGLFVAVAVGQKLRCYTLYM